VSLNKDNALSKETEYRKKYGPRYTYLFKCSEPECTKIIRVRSDYLNRSSGQCNIHSHQKRPFESLYNSLYNDWRGTEVTLTYEEFLEFTKIKKCHYCSYGILWIPFGTVAGEYKSRAYYLDRKNHNEGYTKENCVVCCSKCNIIRRDHFTYEQFLEIGKLINKWRIE
jgi:hypothetical protein